MTDTVAPPWLADELGALLGGGRAIAYRPTLTGAGTWALGGRISTDEPFMQAYDTMLSGVDVAFTYNPLQPDDTQQNCVATLSETHTHGPQTSCVVCAGWPTVGLAHHDQVRVLICDGPALLAWVGGLREQPYAPRERAALAALVPVFRQTFAVRRKLLDAGVAIAGLAAALEAIGAPGFIAQRDGRIDHANHAGARLVDHSAGEVRAKLRDAIAGNVGTSLLAPLGASGLPQRFLVVLHESRSLGELRLREAAQQWHTTDRELAVLRWLVTGDANKEIAIKLGCSEVNVERHVTSLLRKAKCDGRARLVAKYWGAI
jgi:DNA-binding CsgD family transcriptional regulator